MFNKLINWLKLFSIKSEISFLECYYNPLLEKIISYLAKELPDSCPFERDIYLFGIKLFHIPPLCKLNPLYKEVMEKKLESKGYIIKDNVSVNHWMSHKE